MIDMLIVFYMFLALFSLMGAMRGWAKELLVIFSVVMALAFINVVETLIPVLSPFIVSNPKIQYWFRIITVILIAFFGYQSPRISRLAKASERRERVQDFLLGLILGIVSGYMIVGTLWFYLDAAGYYPIMKYVVAPPKDLGVGIQSAIHFLPPAWLGTTPNIYITVVVIAIFIIVVFV
jgi:hypothetical protein